MAKKARHRLCISEYLIWFCKRENFGDCNVGFHFRSLRVPISTSTRCGLSFDAEYGIEELRFELKCYQENTAKICHEIQFDYR